MLIDSYAWIEFFIGSDKGKKVGKILEDEKNFTSIVSVAEIVEWCLKNGKDVEYFTNVMKNYSVILNLNEHICKFSGRINFERKKKVGGWGMIDLFILATALMYDMQILTGDNHFSDIENAVML